MSYASGLRWRRCAGASCRSCGRSCPSDTGRMDCLCDMRSSRFCRSRCRGSHRRCRNNGKRSNAHADQVLELRHSIVPSKLGGKPVSIRSKSGPLSSLVWCVVCFDDHEIAASIQPRGGGSMTLTSHCDLRFHIRKGQHPGYYKKFITPPREGKWGGATGASHGVNAFAVD